MNRTKRIETILFKNFPDYNISVYNNSHLHKGHYDFDGSGETHITIKINKGSKTNLDRLKIHRNINFLLKDEFDMGLHSLEIKIT